MEITNEERREIAESLRDMVDYGCRYYEQFYELLIETVMNDWGFHSFRDTAERLADLIDRPTCRKLIPDEMEGLVFCSNCGAEIGEYGVPNYCHNCGMELQK